MSSETQDRIALRQHSYYNFKLPKYILLQMTSLASQNPQHALSQKCQAQDNRCVCQICTCGKHHCPPAHIYFTAQTCNQEFYKPYNMAIQSSHKNGYTLNQTHYNPELLKSTYTVDYKPVRQEPTHYQSRYAYQPNKAKFYGQTQYNKSFAPRETHFQPPRHCDHGYYKNPARFDGTTTYGAQFQAKKGSSDGPKQHYAYQQNNLPFNGHTTYGDNFKKYEIATERPQTGCESRYQRNNARFEGRSSYRQDFQGKQGEKACGCVVEELPPRPIQCSPGKDHIWYRAQEGRWI